LQCTVAVCSNWNLGLRQAQIDNLLILEFMIWDLFIFFSGIFAHFLKAKG